MMSESELMSPPPPGLGSGATRATATATTTTTATAQPRPRSPRSRTAAPPPSSSTGEKTKRPSNGTRKKRAAAAAPLGDEATTFFISPTLLTWVVSAGVVVLVSVVGFGAGYVIGREVGRQETLGVGGASAIAGNASTAVVDGGSCGIEAIKSGGGTLRRFRWAPGMSSSVAA